ncbi:MAG: MOSC domain-containing protein [Acidobacteriaceae bacterium]|nr:MOSC domain-containing protein [Acidobacteriaceae bacterium]MBV8569900.1 MOSC domain-containing protein [Acidobacteriaceae bacterium]
MLPETSLARGTVVQLNTSKGGVPKRPVLFAQVGLLGIEGDEHRYQYHGGPEQALLLLAAEVVDTLTAEGWWVFYGALGENLTTRGLDYRRWRAGQQFLVGTVRLQLTKPRAPCSALNPYGPGIQSRIYDPLVKARDPASPHWGESGFFAKVLEPGHISVNDIIEAVDPVV